MSHKWMRGLSLLNVIVNVGIIVTGGAVRLTDSGLGCPSWPNCAPGTFQNTEAMGIHGAIEWSNRIAGVVVGLIAVATFLAAVWRKPRRRSLVWLTGTAAVGVAAQGGIGAFTVGTGLAPWLVSIHFAVSIGIVTAAYLAWRRSGEPDGTASPVVPRPVRQLWWLLAGVALAAIAIGTVVTGSGPHSGDEGADRLNLDPELVAQAHADVVFGLLGLTVALLFTVRAIGAPPAVRRAVWWLVGIEVAQGAIGMVQYFTGLPELLVAAHLLGSAVLWIAVLAVGVATRERAPVPVDSLDGPSGSAPAPAPAPPAESAEAAESVDAAS